MAIDESTGKRPVHPLQVLRARTEWKRTRREKLTVDDIVDLRAYERERDDFRRHIIDLKRYRRIELGPIMSIVFENTDTMRWQIQEMARAEKMLRDEQIAHEVATYNELIPDAGELSATLLLELTSELAVREWLPRLVGIERHVRDRASRRHEHFGAELRRGRGAPHARRHDSAVHFLKFRFTHEEIEMFASGPVHIVVDHPEYDQDVALTVEQHAALAADLGDVT